MNKCDRKYVKFNEKINKLKKVAHAPLIPISAKEGDNLEILLESVKGLVFTDSKSKSGDTGKNNMKEWSAIEWINKCIVYQENL